MSRPTYGPYSQTYAYDQWGNLTQRQGWGGEHASYTATFDAGNRRTNFSYDASGHLAWDTGQTFQYDAAGQQVSATAGGLQMSYDGEGLRASKVDNGSTTYYLRSSVFGGQVINEINGSGVWTRGYVYAGSQLLAVQQNNSVSWVAQDPVTKSQRITAQNGAVTSVIDVDPWGGETAKSSNQAFQPHRFTSYERDQNGRYL
ncbi:MAG: hypothetical protein ACJ74W_01450 [Pyrinomonadaceae bacterium]